MKTLIPLFVTTLLLFLTSAVRGNIYEGFDMTEQDSVLLASSDERASVILAMDGPALGR